MSFAGKTVLVVDDEAMVRFVCVAMFEDLGFTVLEAEGGSQALEVLRVHPDVDLLFTDVRMPGMNGPELARIAVERLPRLRVVLVSGYVDSVRETEWPLIGKPFDERTIEAVVSRVLTG